MASSCGAEFASLSPVPSEVPLPLSPTASLHSSCASPQASERCSILSCSTATYERREQEAQDLFNKRIEQLCEDLWPRPSSYTNRFLASTAARYLRTSSLLNRFVPDLDLSLIQHLNGGGFNHVTAVKLPSSYGKEGHQDLIVRVPREDETHPEHQAAMLDFVRSRTRIPVPKIAAADFTSNNTLEKPYVVQHRIPGVDLASVWDEFSHAQRCVVAQELGKVIESLMAVESPVAGVIEASHGAVAAPAGSANIVQWKLEARVDEFLDLEPQPDVDDQNPEAPSRTLGFFTSYLQTWKKAALAWNVGEPDSETELFDGLIRMAQDMQAMDLFSPDLFCLCHLDLITSAISWFRSIPMTS